MNKILLYIKIRRFYSVYGEVLGSNFINKLSDMTNDNLFDVMFDINEVVEGYGYEDTEDLEMLYAQIHKFRFHKEYPLTLNTILFNICNKKVNGFHELRRGTKPIYKLAQWLYKKGVI